MSGVGVPVCSPDFEAPEKLRANSEHICMLEILPIATGVEERVGYDPGVEGPPESNGSQSLTVLSPNLCCLRGST